MTDPARPEGDDTRPQPLHDFVSQRLVERIVAGNLTPREKLSPAKLAEEFGVSHIPVREALAALEAAGHVERVPRVGFFVAELPLGRIEDVSRWRQVIEDEAHRIAVPRLTDMDLTRMRQLDDQAGRALESQPEMYFGLHREFSFVAFRRTGSPTLLRFLDHLWDAAARYHSAVAQSRFLRPALRELHGTLLDAFEARDVDLINERTAEHRSVTLHAVKEMVRPAR